MKPEHEKARIVKAVHGLRTHGRDPQFERDFAEHLKASSSREQLLEYYARFAVGDGGFDALMRRMLFRALVHSLGDEVRIESGVGFKHPETFEIGTGVFIGANSFIQGRIDGRCLIGDNAWIGPQSYFDARDLVIEEYVGWGPGAKVLGSAHTGIPVGVPIIATDLEIRPVRIGAWADIGVNAVILPGISIGKGSIVGAGAVVTRDVQPFAVVAGVPAKFQRWREGYEPEGAQGNG